MHPPIRGLVRDDLRARAAYAEAAGIHRIVPALVARPVDAADVQALIRWATSTGTPLIPRGAGSSMGGGAVGAGCLVDLRDLPPRLDIDVHARTARVSANITLGALEQAAAAHGLSFSPNPSSSAWATVGGVIATNAAGPRTVRDGPVRSWVQDITVVDGHGDLVTFRRGDPTPPRYQALHQSLVQDRRRIRASFPQTRKNTSGYAIDHAAQGDLLHLLIGAEGTLGIVTEAMVGLCSAAAHRASLRLVLPSLDLLAEVVQLLLPHRPAAVELLEQSFLAVAAPRLSTSLARDLHGAAAVLLVDLEGDSADDVTQQLAAVRHAVEPHDVALAAAASAEEAHEIWALRHAASPILAGLADGRRSLQIIEDGCVPITELARYITAVRTACADAGVDCVLFGHAGDGHLHVNLLPRLDDPAWESRVASVYAVVSAAVLSAGGTPAGEHGDGRLRAPLVAELYSPEMLVHFARVKAAFDPHGILNPGVILDPAGADPLAQLKVGDNAAPLPADIAEGLRRIEQSRGYASDRLLLAGDSTGQPG